MLSPSIVSTIENFPSNLFLFPPPISFFLSVPSLLGEICDVHMFFFFFRGKLWCPYVFFFFFRGKLRFFWGGKSVMPWKKKGMCRKTAYGTAQRDLYPLRTPVNSMGYLKSKLGAPLCSKTPLCLSTRRPAARIFNETFLDPARGPATFAIQPPGTTLWHDGKIY